MTTEPAHDRSLGTLLLRVRRARSAVEQCRNGRVARDELADARHELMLALQAYVSALERRKLPVPWRMQAELKLHRDLFDR
ncbi:hypothetical protein [Nocardioides sp.]|uniref:hypothetical protein n=1 Tax=Nocardioides sp. TaxID=35761 RepID=UPI00262D30AB|nr:hypothetical protein [Nocardioides sp.]MDI6908561.1 hypothetical protein [Nocardioides sp.]